MQRKSQFAAEIARAIKARRLTQQGAAELPGVDPSKVARITRAQFRGVSEATLLELVTKLGHDVRIVVRPVRRRAGKIELHSSPERPTRGVVHRPGQQGVSTGRRQTEPQRVRVERRSFEPLLQAKILGAYPDRATGQVGAVQNRRHIDEPGARSLAARASARRLHAHVESGRAPQRGAARRSHPPCAPTSRRVLRVSNVQQNAR